MKGHNAYQIAGGPATLLFWGAPAYMGWVHASRSNNEKRERFLQSANALFWFFFAPVLTGVLWHKPFLKIAGKPELWKQEFLDAIRQNMRPGDKFEDRFKNKIANLDYDQIQKYFVGSEEQKRQLVHRKNGKFLISGLGIPIASLSLVQLLNFRMTERKINRQMQQTGGQPSAPSVQPLTFQRSMTPVASPFQTQASPLSPSPSALGATNQFQSLPPA